MKYFLFCLVINLFLLINEIIAEYGNCPTNIGKHSML